MSKLCVSMAQEVLDMLHGAMLGITKRTSPWHVLYCKNKPFLSLTKTWRLMIDAVTFAAGSVIVAATLCPELGIRLDSDAGRASWDQAVHIFQVHSQSIPTADKALKALELFRRCVMKRAEAARGEIFQTNAALP